jgi:hypothetical protein
VQIGAHVYTVQLTDSNATGLIGHQGDSHAQKLSIRVATRLCNGEERALSDIEEVLLHELIHQVAIVWNVDLDEADIERLAQGMLQALKQYGLELVTRGKCD